MQLEAIEPPHGAFPALGQSVKNFMVKDTFGVADADFGALHKTDTGVFAKADDVQKEHHGSKHFMFDGNKAVVGQ